MTTLTATDLLQLRTIDEAAMVDTATIQHFDSTDDGAGGQIITPGDSFTSPCRILSSMVASDAVVAGQIGTDVNLEVFLPIGTDVRNTDRLVIGTRTFEVRRAVPQTWQSSLRVGVVELT